MALSEINNIKTTQDSAIPTVTSIPVTGSGKQKDIENHLITSIDTGNRSEEVRQAAEEKIQRVSELMNDYIQSLKKDLKIRVNNETGDITVQVISGEDGKVIRQIPSKELLALAARMEEMAGAFFDQVV